MTRTEINWTMERIETLTRLWMQGCPTREIGEKMRLSKNAVVGKAGRLNLAPRPSPIIRNGVPQPLKARPLAIGAVTIPEFRATVGGRIIPATAYGTSGRRMPLPVSVLPVVEVRLARWQEGEGCRFIAGEVTRGQPALYCDAARVVGTAYCPEHGRVCGVHRRAA